MERYDLPIHFGNESGRHEINADSLAVFIDAYKEIFEELSGSKVTIEIGIPTEGGWKTVLTVTIAIMSLIGADNLSILIRGKPSGDIFYTINETIKKFIIEKAAAVIEEYPRKCTEQKNKIYKQFKKDGCIDSFGLGGATPIPKRNFDLYIKELPDDEISYLGITNIIVSSPDWKGKRSWRGKIDIIEDDESAFDFEKDLTGRFWEHVRLDTLPLHTTDIMSVQILHRPNNKIKFRVIRVIRYNEADIDFPLSENDLSKIAGEIEESKAIIKNNPQYNFYDKV